MNRPPNRPEHHRKHPLVQVRKHPGRGKPAITEIRIARIETVTMTAREYTDAVETLAVLIARYERNHPEDNTTTDSAE